METVNSNMPLMVDNFGRDWRALLAPACCRHCGAAAADLPLCSACAASLPWNNLACPRCAQPQAHDQTCATCLEHPPPFDSAWSAFRLESPVQRGLHGLKYRADFLQAGLLGALMAQRLLRRAAPLPQLILPAPLHVSRLVLRGYNQALELGRDLSQEIGIPCDARVLRKIRSTRDQIGLTLAQRRRNVQGAFAITQPLDGQHIALLDDVMTTGATLAELARACRAAGAVKIEAWSAARTP